MPVARTQKAALVAFGTVSFFMADEQRTVRVDVSKELLASIASPPPGSHDGYIARLQRHRALFEQIATAKYDEGQFHGEVKVLVVRIDDTDLTTESQCCTIDRGSFVLRGLHGNASVLGCASLKGPRRTPNVGGFFLVRPSPIPDRQAP